jgi:lipid II:glycine glycyltransferase (peptidoglycan interpeptide bridge formation enzyme)
VTAALRLPSVTELGADALADWDARTVDVPGGDLYQSRPWAEYRSRHGWAPRFLALDDGSRVLALQRPWAWIGGAGAYISRGPVAAGAMPEVVAARLVAVATWLAAHGVDAIASDAEIPAGLGYEAALAAHGFHQIDELQPSRHRMRLVLPASASEDDLLMATDMTTRQRIRGAIKKGLRVRCYDGPGRAPLGDGFDAPPDVADVADVADTASTAAALDRLHGFVAGTGARRSFNVGAVAPFRDWGLTSLAAGRMVLLETVAPDGETLGSAMFYRHGGRLTYSHSGDRADLRRAWPGVAHLQLWRAIQLAHREGIGEVDLGGVDVPGARRIPTEGEPMYGLYAFKRSFGADWVEQAGAQEWIARPWRYGLGRVTGRLAAQARRR